MRIIQNQKGPQFQNFLSMSSHGSDSESTVFLPIIPSISEGTTSKVLNQREKLSKIFARLEGGKDLHIICVPSLTFDEEDVKSVKGLKHYEGRSLWQVLMARHPQIYITFVTTVDIDQSIIDYYLNLLPNSAEVKKRVNVLKVDRSNETKSLVENLLESKSSLKKITDSLDKENSFLLSFLSTKHENTLAEKLDIPLWGCLDELEHYQTKSGNREIFEQANVSFADGRINIKSVSELIESIYSLKEDHEESKRFVVKLDNGVSGDGNAIFNFSSSYAKLSTKREKLIWINEALKLMNFQAKDMTWEQFSKKLPIGSIVELFLEGDLKTSPSVQGRIHPDGSIEIISTHEQILDEKGMKYLGCTFPAKSEFRTSITHQAYKIGKVLKQKGVLGYFAVDFLVMTHKEKRHCAVIEINVRQGGTTHPYQTAKFLTGSEYISSTGLLIDPKGRPVYYCSNDNLFLPNDINIEPTDFISFMKKHDVHYSKENNTGAVFHLLTALKDIGKVGYTVIGHDSKSVLEQSEKIIKLTKLFYSKYYEKTA